MERVSARGVRFLDKLHKACEEVASERTLLDAACRRYEKEAAEAEDCPTLYRLRKCCGSSPIKGALSSPNRSSKSLSATIGGASANGLGKGQHVKVIAIINRIDSPENAERP